MNRRATGAVVALAVAVGATACSPAEDVLGLRRNTQASRPALSGEQAMTVAERALGRAVRADALQDAQQASAAYTGLALRLAGPTYTVERVLDPQRQQAAGALQAPPTPSRVVVAAGRQWPRSMLTVARPDGAATAQLSVLRSADARTPYRVAARVDLLPGAALPRTAPVEQGAAVLGPDATGLVATPRRALADYATLLRTGRTARTDGKQSTHGTAIAADVVVRSVRDNATSQARGVAAVATFTQDHRVEPDSFSVLRTADGGALVVAAVDRIDRFRVRKGAGTIKPPAAYTALAKGVTRITQRADVTTVQLVALVLPPAGGGPARVVGFSEHPVQVTAS
jgi:hypothetical protein